MDNEEQFLTSDYHPHANIMHKENDKYIILIGSLTAMIKNKNINQTALFISILENEHIQDLFIEIVGVECLQELLAILLNRYPQLCTSKTVSNFIKGQNAKSKRNKRI